jgi:hypothetical protein
MYMKPEDQIIAWLNAHKSGLQYGGSTVDDVVKQVKLFVFFNASPIPDDAIRKVVANWAMFNAPLMLIKPSTADPKAPAAGTPQTNSDSELIDAVKKAVSTVSAGVTVGKKGANVNIGVTGLTANLKKGDSSVSLGISWTGTLNLDAESGPFHFSGNLSKDKWEITLSYPQDTYIPDLSTLGKVFTEGEKGIRKIADATSSFKNINDASKIGALVKPHVSAVRDAIDAVSGIAKADKKGGASFGFKIGSPEPGPGQQGIPGGVQGQIVFTYTF